MFQQILQFLFTSLSLKVSALVSPRQSESPGSTASWAAKRSRNGPMSVKFSLCVGMLKPKLCHRLATFIHFATNSDLATLAAISMLLAGGLTRMKHAESGQVLGGG